MKRHCRTINSNSVDSIYSARFPLAGLPFGSCLLNQILFRTDRLLQRNTSCLLRPFLGDIPVWHGQLHAPCKKTRTITVLQDVCVQLVIASCGASSTAPCAVSCCGSWPKSQRAGHAVLTVDFGVIKVYHQTLKRRRP